MVLSDAERQELLHLYEGLRVADVRDALDTFLYHHACSMAPAIRPLWRTHAFGIARTVRYLPFQGGMPRVTPEEYWAWVYKYYAEVCPYPWMATIQAGDFWVVDQSGVDAGLMGSENTLAAFRKGARGFASSGAVRDTDEIILQQIPFWSTLISQKMVQARLQFDATDVPVCVGGVTVVPGDVVVADGDGVLVVPQKIAREVARFAEAEHRKDMATRREHYRALGRPLDKSVGEG
jgi:4-hydroxy-4-methyl-2-oxoglutarate aldolase